MAGDRLSWFQEADVLLVAVVSNLTQDVPQISERPGPIDP